MRLSKHRRGGPKDIPYTKVLGRNASYYICKRDNTSGSCQEAIMVTDGLEVRVKIQCFLRVSFPLIDSLSKTVP